MRWNDGRKRLSGRMLHGDTFRANKAGWLGSEDHC